MTEYYEQEDFQPVSLANDNVANMLNSMSDEVLQSFSFPMFSSTNAGVPQKMDADGFPTVTPDDLWDLHRLQKECWEKADKNPQVSSHVRDKMGRMAGWGFEFNSKHPDIQKAIEETMEDPRNDLYTLFPRFCARKEVEGELFLMLSLHKDGFVEVDFISPSMVRGGGDKGSGIIHHPTKQTFPLFYLVNFDDEKDEGGESINQVLVPSINIAYFPDLEEAVEDHGSYDSQKLKFSKARKQNSTPYDKYNGYFRFMLYWNGGLMTKRNVSHIKTTIEWVNYYEALKKYEIDHKKSSGAYLWVITMEDVQAFRRWLQMPEEDRKKTGIMQPKEPGGTLVLPPGMQLTVQNPSLPNISDQDTDIMQMVSSGLQATQDTMLGDYRSTYASVKASQGPQGDRINDDLWYFRLFLIYSFWRGILFLRSSAKKDFPFERRIEDVVGFEDQEPVKQKVTKPVYKLVEVCLPTSRLEDIESFSKAYLGSKHGSLVDVLGIPREEVAKRLGFSNYGTLRKKKALEDDIYPETVSVDDVSGDSGGGGETERKQEKVNNPAGEKAEKKKK